MRQKKKKKKRENMPQNEALYSTCTEPTTTSHPSQPPAPHPLDLPFLCPPPHTHTPARRVFAHRFVCKFQSVNVHNSQTRKKKRKATNNKQQTANNNTCACLPCLPPTTMNKGQKQKQNPFTPLTLFPLCFVLLCECCVVALVQGKKERRKCV